MTLWLNPDSAGDVLYVRFQKGKFVAKTEWISESATVDLGFDDSPIGVSIMRFSQREWPFTEQIMTKYRLGSWDDDLRTVHESYFNSAKKPVFSGFRPR